MAQPNRVKANTKYRRGIGFGKKTQQVPSVESNTDTHQILSPEDNVSE